MPVPKKRTSKRRRDMRRAHDFLTARATVTCPNCGVQMIPHRVCMSCGHYKGRSVIAMESSSK